MTICYDASLSVSFTTCGALVELYDALSGDSWLDQSGWLISPSVDTRFGIEVENSDVVAIDMGDIFANNIQ
jgi:hypothetical protein